MSSPTPAHPPDPPPPPTSGELAGWFCLAAIGVGALYLAAVHLPGRLKLPLITPVALGGIVGWALGVWGGRIGPSRWIARSALILIPLGQIGMGLESYRLGVGAVRRDVNRVRLERSPLADEIEQALEAAESDPQVRAQLAADHAATRARRQQELLHFERFTTFRGYLENRIPTRWGRWPSPWPEALLAAEVLLGTALGAWLAARRARS
ncbi:MAG: hypothetical protein ACKV0T_17385 [Planctomycetales bacterium]